MGLEGRRKEGRLMEGVELRSPWYEEGRTLTGCLPRAAMGQGQTERLE